MSKYKARLGDRLPKGAVVINQGFDNYGWFLEYAHEPAPEPIVIHYAIYKDGYIHCCTDNYDETKDVMKHGRLMGYIKVTQTGNDFTVEKVE